MSTPDTPFYPMTHDDAVRLALALEALNPGPAGSDKQGFMGPAAYLANGLILAATQSVNGLMSAADKTKLDACEIAAPHNYAYDGRNLKEVFGTAAAFGAALRAGDFSKIRVGDYWPLTISGTFKDYATGNTKTLSNAVFKMEVASINPYWKYGDSGTLTNGIPNLVLLSRDLLPFNIQFRSENATWYDASANQPWRGSHLFQSFNNASDGLIRLIEASELGPYIYGGPNGKGMRHLMEIKGPSANDATSWEWGDRGKLFLPTEREVWGAPEWSGLGYSGAGGALQWDIFAGSRRHIIKGLGDGGSRNAWWCESSQSGSTSRITRVTSYGLPDGASAADTWISAPVGFLVA